MDTLFIEYPTCSTCRKAKKFLETNKVTFIDRHIVEDTPSIEELSSWVELGNLNIDKLFNTSGQVYRSLHLKDTLASMSKDEKYALLASNGMLIKRPLFIHNNKVLLGFKEEDWMSCINDGNVL